jgi:AcrR family transcriptional regulator
MPGGETGEPGLRERKRLATRRALQLAALELVNERGLDATTVDEISRRADVSPRTFFNYFPSKEEALAGEGPRMPDAASIEDFVAARGPLLVDLADLLALSVEDEVHDPEIVRARRDLLRTAPHISALRIERFRHFETDLVAVAERRVGAQHPELDAEERSSRARLAVFVAVAAMRDAWLSSAEDAEPAARLADRLRASLARLAGLLPEMLPR